MGGESRQPVTKSLRTRPLWDAEAVLGCRGHAQMQWIFRSSGHHEFLIYTPEKKQPQTALSKCEPRCWTIGFNLSQEAGLGPWEVLTLTVTAVVIHQDDLLEQMRGRAFDGWVDGAQQHRKCFIDEDEHDAHLRQAVRKREVTAPAKNSQELRFASDSARVTSGADPPRVLAPALLEGSGVQILPRAPSLMHLRWALNVQQ